MQVTVDIQGTKVDLTIASAWSAGGMFKANIEYVCGDCGKYNRKHTPRIDRSTRIAFSGCNWCGEINAFRTGKSSSKGNVRLLTIS
jgi:hypothetical protein